MGIPLAQRSAAVVWWSAAMMPKDDETFSHDETQNRLRPFELPCSSEDNGAASAVIKAERISIH